MSVVVVQVEANRADGEIDVELSSVSNSQKFGFILDVPDALFLARRILEELETFEGLAR